jgi:LAO/AO transport system kinase
MVTPQALAEQVTTGDRRALSRAITLIESRHPDHRPEAEAFLAALPHHAGSSLRLGISGVPGVGKSTFIEALGLHAIADGRKIAVLAVDPSSPIGGGSILGDKTRMPELAHHLSAFIRPSPAGETLGGVARRTSEAVTVCEAAGFDLIVVETVGVGQSETAVADMVDAFLLLLAPGGGDELQGIKRGIVERADLIVVNKADGELRKDAERVRREYATALNLLRPRTTAGGETWSLPALACSARDGDGISDVWNAIQSYRLFLEKNGGIAKRRLDQARDGIWRDIAESLTDRLRAHPGVRVSMPQMERQVAAGALTPAEATRRIIAIFVGE